VSYDGTRFIGIDDDAMAEDQPLDAWLEQRVAAQGACLAAQGDVVSWSPTEFDEGERAYASVAWTCVFARVVPVDQSFESVTVEALCTIATTASAPTAAAQIEARLVLEGLGTRRATWAAGAEVSRSITLAPTRKAEGPSMRLLELWIRSNVTQDSVQTTVNGYTTAPAIASAPASVTPYPTELTPGPSKTTLNEQCTAFGEQAVGATDHIISWRDASVTVDRMALAKAAAQQAPNSLVLTTQALSYLVLRSLVVSTSWERRLIDPLSLIHI